METKIKIGIILGTNRPNRIGEDIARWVKQTMADPNLTLDILDLAKIDLPFLDEPEIPAKGNYQQEHTKKWSQTIQQYDGFVLLFPQYNWGYPAVMKNALDYLYTEWAGKPVSIMVYGNHSGFQGLIAMELVTQGLKMITMAVNPPLVIKQAMFAPDGTFLDIKAALAPSEFTVQLVTAEFKHLLAAKKVPTSF